MISNKSQDDTTIGIETRSSLSTNNFWLHLLITNPDTYVLPLAYQQKTVGELLFGVEDTSNLFFGEGGVE